MTHLPTGYTLRPARFEDAQAFAELINQQDAEVGIHTDYTVEKVLTNWKSPVHDFANHSIVIEDSTGQIISVVNLWRFANPPVRMWLGWMLDPNHRHIGIEAVIFEWVKARAHEQLVNCPPDVKVVLHSSAYVKHAYRNAIFVAQNWQDVRHFYFMRIDMTEQPPVPTFPEGFTIRGLKYPEEAAETLKVDIEAFRDHWGFTESNFEEELKEFTYDLENNPDFDPALFFVIVDNATGKFIGNVWSFLGYDGHPDYGYIDGVAVLREFRGRGLAENGLRHVFHALYERGKRIVTLWVDADSLTGALRLYEKVGMHVAEETVRYEWVIREGTDRMTRSLD